jgi:hypothetical protein
MEEVAEIDSTTNRLALILAVHDRPVLGRHCTRNPIIDDAF